MYMEFWVNVKGGWGVSHLLTITWKRGRFIKYGWHKLWTVPYIYHVSQLLKLCPALVTYHASQLVHLYNSLNIICHK